MDQELTGVHESDFTKLRVWSETQGQFIDIIDLLASGATGVTSLHGGNGIVVTGNNGAFTITNAAIGQGAVGPQGNPGSAGPMGSTGIQGQQGVAGLRSLLW